MYTVAFILKAFYTAQTTGYQDNDYIDLLPANSYSIEPPSHMHAFFDVRQMAANVLHGITTVSCRDIISRK